VQVEGLFSDPLSPELEKVFISPPPLSDILPTLTPTSTSLWSQLWFFLNEPLFIGFTYVITDKATTKFHFFLHLFSSFLLFRCLLGPRFNTRELDSAVVYVG